jgi:predicted HAD superfamily Cof-like phosphohydrolase
MKPWHQLVAEFHLAGDQPIEARPITLRPISEDPEHHALRSLRARLLDEEFREYMQAESENDITEIADALGDIIYVALGTALAYGIPADRVLREIHRSNMTKVDPVTGKMPRRADGKIIKGPGYQPPDIAGVLEDSRQRTIGCPYADRECTFPSVGICVCRKPEPVEGWDANGSPTT